MVKKKVIRLTESELKEVVKNATMRVLRETFEYDMTIVDGGDKEIKDILSKLSKEDLDKIWIDYSTIRHAANYSNPLTIHMISNIHEGLIHTYPLDKTISYIKSYFGLADWQIMQVLAANGVNHINVIIPNISNNLELMKEAMNLCGYYWGSPKEDTFRPNVLVALQFEVKVEEDKSEQIRNEETALYHLTPCYNRKKIEAIGFSPRCKNELFNYPSRVYFLRGSLDMNEIINIGTQLSNANNSIGNTGDYALFTIDLSAIPNDVKLSLDPNNPYGIYTTSNIKPNVITKIQNIKFP